MAILDACDLRYRWIPSLLGGHDCLSEEAQALHCKGGQGAKTGTGGHLPGAKVVGKIAATRGLEEEQDAISPRTFESPTTVKEFRRFADEVRGL